MSARRAKYPRRPRRVALKGGPKPSLRPVNTERVEARRHGGIQELGCTHLCNVPPGSFLISYCLYLPTRGQNGRDALVASVYGTQTPCPRVPARSVLTGRRPRPLSPRSQQVATLPPVRSYRAWEGRAGVRLEGRCIRTPRAEGGAGTSRAGPTGRAGARPSSYNGNTGFRRGCGGACGRRAGRGRPRG